jgi:catechol 2,3-dioxygenase-like lactoylglutathione lyase family enzyme
MYLSYTGIRVTNLEKSLAFYRDIFGLEEVARGDNTGREGGIYVLLRDRKSGQKLELNWYPKGSTYDTPYSSGDGLDHLAFLVEGVTESLKQLSAKGIETVGIPTSLSEQPGANPTEYSATVSYVKDPDGNWVELYSHTRQREEPIPIAY